MKPTGVTISFTKAEVAWLIWLTSGVLHDRLVDGDCMKLVLASESARQKIGNAAETINSAIT